MNGILSLLRSLGPGRLAAMGAVALGLIGFFAYLILRLDTVTQAPLYAGLTMTDASAIIEELNAASVPYTLTENGTAILVPEAEVLRLRMTLAEGGLPAGGGVGYEIFDKTDALGTTSFVQNINQLRALEGELSRTIRTLRKVENARVHLVMPERQLFRREEQKPTASIVLKTRGSLDAGEIRAIQHLVASAVPNLEPGRISVVDGAGRLLAEGTGEDSADLMASRVDERTATYQADVEQRLRDIVESVVGAGRARVKVAAELDFNRVSETQDIFDPNGQVVRSTQSRDESSQTTEDGNGQVTVGNQVPNAAQPATPPGQADPNAPPTVLDANNVSEETVNYEISKTTRTAVTEIGGVKRLSVAVLVDGRYQTDSSGTQAYAPRPQAELDQIAALVRTAMGFSESRGDQIQVINLQFADGPAVETEFSEEGLLAFTRDDMMRFTELGVMAVLTLLVLLFAVRPLVRRILEPDTQPSAAGVAGALPSQMSFQNVAMVIGPDGQAMTSPQEAGAPRQLEGPGNSRIDEARAAGAHQMDQVRRVGELVKENPNEASIIIRNWLGEAA